jgi:hypothetical protein
LRSVKKFGFTVEAVVSVAAKQVNRASRYLSTTRKWFGGVRAVLQITGNFFKASGVAKVANRRLPGSGAQERGLAAYFLLRATVFN